MKRFFTSHRDHIDKSKLGGANPDCAPSQRSTLDDRKLLHRSIYEYSKKGWQVTHLDHNSVDIVHRGKWNRTLLIIGTVLLPLLGLGVVIWIVAFADYLMRRKQRRHITLDMLKSGLETVPEEGKSIAHWSTPLFILLMVGWLLAVTSFISPGTYPLISVIPTNAGSHPKAFAGIALPQWPAANFSHSDTDPVALLSSEQDTPTPTATISATPSVQPSATATPYMPLSNTLTPTNTSTPTPSATPTPDPSDWKKWPVIPAVSERVKKIYQRGIENGNNPHAFSVVGDCQSFPYLFMGGYDTGSYNTDDLGDNLKETIEWFSGSFSRYGFTILDGANAATELALGWANRNYCSADESFLNCELRLNKPSFVIVNIGTHWTSRNEQYLRKIIETIIDNGSVPILATKADNLEGDFSINQQIANLAAEYELPLWNLWRSVQDLTDHGLDPYRQGGYMYLTSDGLRKRRETALKALDVVWRAVR
jgi:hypothetical protein